MQSLSGSSKGLLGRFTVVVAIAIAYPVVRYNIFAGVAWREAPLFVSNKGVSLAAVIFFAFAYLTHRVPAGWNLGSASRTALARAAGLTGFGLTVAHTLVSLFVFSEERYPLLFNSAGLTDAGLVSLTMAVIAIPCFALPAIYSFPRLSPYLGPANWTRAQRIGYAGLALTALHVAVLGWRNWFTPDRWPGGLPPISLVSFGACVLPLVVKGLAVRRVGRAAHQPQRRIPSGFDRPTQDQASGISAQGS